MIWGIDLILAVRTFGFFFFAAQTLLELAHSGAQPLHEFRNFSSTEQQQHDEDDDQNLPLT